ncbi:DUF5712 family protein, partial [Muricauda sp. ANG21]|uniref:DUF5712 family protein n=1 Tax=Allomuricauda sp. ANG21 TaxID=3042468 RepID=UPI003454EC79
MYIAITRQHLGDNYHGSASDFVKYLEKENEGKAPEEQEFFFNQTENDIDAQRVIAEIDANTAKLSKRDPKFYSIMVSPSQAELKHIVQKQRIVYPIGRSKASRAQRTKVHHLGRTN